jgi:hypothetical protein
VKKISGVGGKFFGDLFNFFRFFEKPCYEFSKFQIFFVLSERGHEYLQLLCGTTSGGRKMDLSRIFENFDFFSNFFLFFFLNNSIENHVARKFQTWKHTFLKRGVFYTPRLYKNQKQQLCDCEVRWVGGPVSRLWSMAERRSANE